MVPAWNFGYDGFSPSGVGRSVVVSSQFLCLVTRQMVSGLLSMLMNLLLW